LEMQNQKPESTMDMDWEKDEEMRARLDNGDKPGKISVPLNLIHSDEGYENNSADLKNLMTKRQKQEYRTSKKVADQRENSFVDDVQRMENEKKIDNVSEVSKVPEQRSLRFKQRQNYEEMNDEDFNSLLLKPKAVVVQHHVSNSEDEQKVQSVSGNQPSMRVRERNRMTDYETSLLEKWFNLNPYPTSEERDIIAEMMEMPEKKVRVWFQNKRYKTEDGRMKSMYAKNASISSTISSSERKASSVGPSIPSSSSDCQHPCKLCNQNFTSETDHKIHIKRVHGNDGEKVVCKECLKAFDTLWNLKTHQIEEHMSLGINGEIYGEYQSSDDNGSRTKFSRSQIITLRHAFAKNPYPTKEEYSDLQISLGVPNKILHSWFQNHRHREKIHTQKHHDFIEEMYGEETWDDEDPRSWPYNPGHKKTRFTDHQKLYLQSFFEQKEYVDDEDIHDLSSELRLSPKVIRIWFQHAREKKKKNIPIYARLNKPSKVSNTRNRSKSPRPSGIKFEEESFDDIIIERQELKSEEDKEENVVVLTEFQKIYLEDFYKNIQEPDDDDIDYLCEHINVTRNHVTKWFQEKNDEEREKQLNYNAQDVCISIMDGIIKKVVSQAKDSNFQCPYCGKGFKNHEELKEHEKLEAIEFEKEVSKFKEEELNDDSQMFVSLDDDHQSKDTFVDDDIFDEDIYADNSVDSSTYGNEASITPFMIWLQEEQKRTGNSSVAVRNLASIWQNMSDFDKMPYIEECRRLRESAHLTPTGRLTRKNHPLKTYICKRCEVGFSTKGNLYKHLKHFHPDNPFDPKLHELDVVKKRSGNVEFTSNMAARHRSQDNMAPYYDESSSDHDRYRNYDYYETGVPDVSSSSDGFCYDDYQQYERSKPPQVKTKFTEYQRKILMDSFHRSLQMSKIDAKNFYMRLAERLDLPAKIVRIWFQNARSARKKGKPLFNE